MSDLADLIDRFLQEGNFQAISVFVRPDGTPTASLRRAGTTSTFQVDQRTVAGKPSEHLEELMRKNMRDSFDPLDGI